MNTDVWRYRRRGSRGPEIVLAPLLDMMFLLLIFFVVTTTFAGDLGIEVQKPRVSEADELASRGIRITVSRDGGLSIDGRPVVLSDIAAIVRARIEGMPGTPVVLIADAGSVTGTVVSVMDQVRRAGVDDIALAVEEER